MSFFQRLKRGLAASTIVALTASMTLSPVVPAFAEAANSSADSDEIVGNLSIVSMFDPSNTSISSITDGHSFVLFTSYKDDLELNFTDLYGYYKLNDDFKVATEADINQLSWRAQFDEVSKQVGSDVSLEEYLKTGEDYREHAYPSLYQAIYDHGDKCFTYTEGADGSGKDERYRKTSYDCTLNSGEYITIGDYVFSNKSEMIKYAFMDSTLKDELFKILDNNITGDVAQETIINTLLGYLDEYVSGKIDGDQLQEKILTYVKGVLTQTGYDAFVLLLGAYQNRINLLDGDAKGGMFVNRELWRQKVYQTIYPNKIYSIDITRSQLERMMAFVNSGTENHYAVLTHNCSTLSSGIWNATVGTDESGNKTALYVDAYDETYDVLSGMFTTPKKISSVLASWEGKDLGGTLITNQEIIHGVDVPEPEPVTYTVTFDSAEGSAVEAQTVESGSCAIKPVDPTRDGYTFKGWLLNGEAYDFSTPVTADITLTALWEKNADPQPTPEPEPEPEPTPELDKKPSKKSDGALPQTGDASFLAVAAYAGLGAVALVIARRRLN